MLKIAVGPGGPDTEWTETIMKAYQHHEWSWNINGLSMHSYTVVRWPPAFASVGFGESEYSADPEVHAGNGRSGQQAVGGHGQVRPAKEGRPGGG